MDRDARLVLLPRTVTRSLCSTLTAVKYVPLPVPLPHIPRVQSHASTSTRRVVRRCALYDIAAYILSEKGQQEAPKMIDQRRVAPRER